MIRTLVPTKKHDHRATGILALRRLDRQRKLGSGQFHPDRILAKHTLAAYQFYNNLESLTV